jgi:glucose-1-phosphate cytidylyltransferase
MKTVILCGGQGTRIRDVASDVPKPMINVGPFPILWHIMKGYAHWGYQDFVLCLGYQGHVIKDFFVNYQVRTSDVTIRLGRNGVVQSHAREDEEAWRITLAETGMNAQTGARVRRVQRYLEGEPTFMLTYGDGVSDIDIPKLVEFHQRHGKVMTVSGMHPLSRFGELEIDGDRVVSFAEKPQTTAGAISGGFFVCDARLFDYMDDYENLELEIGPMQRLVKDDQLMVYRHYGFWHPMDTYRDYKLLNDLWDAGKAPWKLW